MIKRNNLTYAVKAAMIEAIESGISNSEVAKKFNSKPSTVSNILKNKEMIQKNLKTTTVLKRKRLRHSNYSDIEEELFKWHEDKKNQGITINGPMLQMQANLIGQSLGKNFQCTESWIYRFRMRHNIVFRKNFNEQSNNNENVKQKQQHAEEKVLEETDWGQSMSRNIKCANQDDDDDGDSFNMTEEQQDAADESLSNFGSFSNMEARPIQQVVEGNELFTILEPPPLVRPTTSREKPPSAKRQKRVASDRHDNSYNENVENIENIENMENNENMENIENIENIPNNHQTLEYPKWKEERYELFGKIALMKMHDITNDAQRLFAEKLINEALSLAELNLLTPGHAINAPFVPFRPPLVERQFSRHNFREPTVNGQNQTPPRNQDVAENGRAEPEYLQDRNQNISQDSNVATPPPNQNQNINIPKTSTTEQNVSQSDLKRAATTAATGPSKAKIERRPFASEQRDASDSFGEHVAAKHRQYTDYVKSYVEHEISQVLFEADMGKYDHPPEEWPSQAMPQQRPSATLKVSNTNNATTNATNSRAAFNTNSAGAAQRTKTATTVRRRSSTSAGAVQAQTMTAGAPFTIIAQPSTSAVHHTAVGAAGHSRTTTAQHSNAATTAVDQSHLLDPNIVIKSSPAHTPSYSSEIDDNDEESETVLSNTGAPPFVANERMSEDEEEILSYNG